MTNATQLYSKVRDDLKTGDLIAWRITKINSFFTFILYFYQKIFKVSFSHVGVVVTLSGRTFIVEATPPKVRLFPLSMLDDFYVIKTNIVDKPGYEDLLFKHLGKSYSLFDMIKSYLNIQTSNAELYCSELAKDFYYNVGYIVDDDAGRTPDTLVDAVTKVSNTTPYYVIIDRGNLTGV